MVQKIISGGQTGADQGGLFGAAKCNITTGGWATKNYKTENGYEPTLLQSFGLIETNSERYEVRTELNVMDSDGTLIVAGDLTSKGTKCTLEACRSHGKPFLFTPFSLDFMKTLKGVSEEETKRIHRWINHNNIKTLNVAGNRKSVAPGIQMYTEDLIVNLFK